MVPCNNNEIELSITIVFVEIWAHGTQQEKRVQYHGSQGMLPSHRSVGKNNKDMMARSKNLQDSRIHARVSAMGPILNIDGHVAQHTRLNTINTVQQRQGTFPWLIPTSQAKASPAWLDGAD